MPVSLKDTAWNHPTARAQEEKKKRVPNRRTLARRPRLYLRTGGGETQVGVDGGYDLCLFAPCTLSQGSLSNVGEAQPPHRSIRVRGLHDTPSMMLRNSLQ